MLLSSVCVCVCVCVFFLCMRAVLLLCWWNNVVVLMECSCNA
jgi:hypothetical protein